MTDANDDRMHVEGIKSRCNPGKFNDQTMQVLTAMVEQATEVRDQSAVRQLTSNLLDESYKGLARRDMDDRCYESDRHFMRALVLETMARAQEYCINVQTENKLSRNDGEDRAR